MWSGGELLDEDAVEGPANRVQRRVGRRQRQIAWPPVAHERGRRLVSDDCQVERHDESACHPGAAQQPQCHLSAAQPDDAERQVGAEDDHGVDERPRCSCDADCRQDGEPSWGHRTSDGFSSPDDRCGAQDIICIGLDVHRVGHGLVGARQDRSGAERGPGRCLEVGGEQVDHNDPSHAGGQIRQLEEPGGPRGEARPPLHEQGEPWGGHQHV